MAPKGQRAFAYGVLFRWFTDVSGLGLAEQARMLMHLAPPVRKEDLSEHVEIWQDKTRRLEAHGDEFKLAPVFNINVLSMLMAGKDKEYLFSWEAHRDTTDLAKLYEELLTKAKDHSRRRKLDISAKQKRPRGEEPIDVGSVGGWGWTEDTGGGYDQGDGVYAFGFKCKVKSKGKGK